MELKSYLVVETARGWKKYIHLYDSPKDCTSVALSIAPNVYVNIGEPDSPDFSGLYYKDKSGKRYGVLRHGNQLFS